MKIIQSDIWFCEYCTEYAINDDLTSIDFSYRGEESEKKAKEVKEGVQKFGCHLVPDHHNGGDITAMSGFDDHSQKPCAACGDKLHGSRYRFAVLGEGDDGEECEDQDD